MTISSRDRRALILLSVAVIVVLAYSIAQPGHRTPEVTASADAVRGAELRLAQVRRLAAQVPSREQQVKVLEAELASWERAVLRPETAQQAQAELLKILRRVGNTQTPPLEFRSEEIGLVRPVGKEKIYGEVLVSVSLTCPVEQLVNLLADLTAQPEAIATEELRITAGNPKDKNLTVRLTVSGLVPHQLIPAQKGLVSF